MSSYEYFGDFLGDSIEPDLDTGQNDAYYFLGSDPFICDDELLIDGNDTSHFVSNSGTGQPMPHPEDLTHDPLKNQSNDSLAMPNSFSSFQQCTNHTLFENNLSDEKEKKSSFRLSHKSPKRKMVLSSKAQQFKYNFYSVFTKKKKFPKQYVKKIHMLIQGPLNLKPLSRTVYRFIDMYFDENVNCSEEIIQYLCNNKADFIAKIPELKQYA